MGDIFVTYPGGKNGSGTFQKIINLMPPHRTYVEPFLGGGAILRAKRPAMVNIGIDLDRTVVREWGFVEWRGGIPNLTVYWADAITWLREAQGNGKVEMDWLVYCDPPYLMETRSSQRQLYAFEMAEAGEHERLLEVLLGLRCMVMISGYWSELYAAKLAGWWSYSFQAVTRSGKMATEWVWMNFPEPLALHDYRFLGDTFRDRDRIRRRKLRWKARLEKMPMLERRAMLLAIDEVRSGSVISGDDGDRDDGHRPSSAEMAVSADNDNYGEAAGRSFSKIDDDGDVLDIQTEKEMKLL